MRNIFRTAFRSAIVASSLAVGLAGAPAGARAQSRNDRDQIDTTFLFDKAGTVVLGNGSATIVVTGWDEGTIRVRARGDQGLLRFSASARRVTIDPTRSSDDVEIQVWVPRGVRVEARTNSGDITIKGTRGDIDAQTSSGDVAISDAREVSASSLSGDVGIRQTSGAVTATTSNGDLGVADAHGNIDATSISGDVTITRAASKVVRATVTSGDITYSGAVEPDGRYELTTHSGDIELTLPKDASAQVGVTTWNGTVDSDFPITLKPGTNTASFVTKHYTFTIGSGSAHITAETFSGDIVINSRGGK
jgi:DUF4097 and DUF4098 domain-containing protein YvlB